MTFLLNTMKFSWHWLDRHAQTITDFIQSYATISKNCSESKDYFKKIFKLIQDENVDICE